MQGFLQLFRNRNKAECEFGSSIRSRRDLRNGLGAATRVLGFWSFVFVGGALARACLAALGHIVGLWDRRQLGGFSLELARIAHDDLRVAAIKPDLPLN